ncbi:MAG: PKD domain-containing protein [Chloroflexota bacterium]
MAGKSHTIWYTTSFFILLATLGGYWLTARPTEASSYAGTGQLVSEHLLLDFAISPPVAQPGDTVTLAVRLSNRSEVAIMPEIRLQLPPTMRSRINDLPAGATINVQANELSWQPVVQANGGSAQFNVPLRVETADITQPEQTITAVLTHNNQQSEGHALIWVGIPPQISAVLNVTHVAAGQTVRLLPTISGSAPFSQMWLLGDGRRVDVNNPELIFPNPGVYDVVLEVTNPVGRVSKTQQITIVPHPAAQFTVDDDTPGLGQAVRFDNQSGGQGQMRYLWHFGDGNSSEDRNPTHVYTTPGLFQVQLTAANDYGQSDAYWTIAVGSPPAVELFINDSVPMGQVIIGQSAADDSTEQVVWDMGNGRSYDTAKINHIYRRPGDYYVTVTASNRFGTSQAGKWVHVDSGRTLLYLPYVVKAQDGSSGQPETAAAPVVDVGIELEPVELAETFVMEPMQFERQLTAVEALFRYVNEARRQFNLPPLAYSYELSVAAQLHADDMAAYNFTGHGGADGSTPQERYTWASYPRAYAGEATAWGFEDPRHAVEFWVNSPPHRPIILNQYATELGVGYGTNYGADSVWYWTAEFGNSSGAAVAPVLRLNQPQVASAALNTDTVGYSWNWSAPLADGQQFAVLLYVDGQAVEIGTTSQPWHNLRYRVETTAVSATLDSGSYEWQVVLRSGNTVIAQSERRTITITADPNLPTPTPEPTLPVEMTPLPTPGAAATPLPTTTSTPEPTSGPPPAPTRSGVPTATPGP